MNIKTIYLAYGSNLNIDQMAYRCKTAKIIGKTLIEDYRLLFRGVATIERHKGGKVPVLLWELGLEDEAALDIYEGFPVFYRKEYLRIETEKEKINAMAYLMNDGRSFRKPNKYYFNTILEGYKSAGFDIEILKKALLESN